MPVAGPVVLALIELIALTKLDGTIAFVNPAHIVQLVEPRDEDTDLPKQFVSDVKCVVFLAGGKYISVRETCTEVRKLFVEEKPP